MDTWTNHVTAKLQLATFNYYPYKYIVVDNIFPDDLITNINVNKIPTDSLPLLKDVRFVPRGYSDARRAISLVTNTDYIPESSKSFWNKLSGWMVNDLTRLIIDKFEITKKYRTDVLYSRDGQGYQLGPHTDKPGKILTLLFYVSSTPIDKRFGTAIFVPKNSSFRCPGHGHHTFDNFDLYENIEYVPNRVFGFVKNDCSFHGVLPIDRVCDRDLLIYNLQIANK